MDSTSGTRSSENESTGYEMSYLYGRDPSILSFGQRPFPPAELKKNLMSSLEQEDEKDEVSTKISCDNSNSTLLQTVKVFLRMKPYPVRMKVTSEQKNAYSILDSTTLLTQMPSMDNNTSCLKKNKLNDYVCRSFTFTKIFGADTTQLELFESAIKSQMIDFLAGKNSVAMSYGTTNSGKTYTLQGTPESPGIIPRGIEFVFSNITTQVLPKFKPINCGDVIYLSNSDRRQEMEIKTKLLSFNSAERSSHLQNFNEMQKLIHKESPTKINRFRDDHYSVWVSFAEIYNETIYDLLSNNCQKKRPSLKLVADNKGRAYIKGLKSVCVNSSEEAYQILMVGQYNLKVAATALNSRSSRSHCIFTIKLLKYKSEHDPQSVDVSTFAFCDLAGSERLKKTLNIGERLKEAQNINTSLLVLGRCLRTIYDSQNNMKLKNESVAPFRESKLTRLFQRALSGKEEISLIVNVNPVPNLYVETQNVLNFAAIAKKIVVENHDFSRQRRSRSRFSRLVTQSLKTEMDWEDLDDVPVVSEDYTDSDYDAESNDEDIMSYDELLTENEMLKKEIQSLKESALTRDIKTRQEMTDMYTKILKNLELDWKNRMTDMEEQQEDLRELAVERVESFYEQKLKQQSQLLNENNETGTSSVVELELENVRLQTSVETYKKSIQNLKIKYDSVKSEKAKLLAKLSFLEEEVKRKNLSLSMVDKSINPENDKNLNDYIEELNEIIKVKNERINKMKVFLNEAKEEYITITNQAQKMETQLEEQEKQLAEKTEHIRDLEEQLFQANECTAQQTKIIETLEEELEILSKKSIVKIEKTKDTSKLLSSLNSDNTQNYDVTNEEKNDHSEKSMPSDDKSFKKCETEEVIEGKLDQTNSILQAELFELKQQLQEKNKQIEALHKTLEEERMNLEGKISELEISLDGQKNQIKSTLQAQLFELEQQVQEKNKQIEALHEESEKEKINLEEKISELKISLDDKKTHTSSTLQTQLFELEEQVQEKNKQIEALHEESEKEKTNLEEKISELKISLDDKKNQTNSSLQIQLLELEQQVQEKNKQIEALHEESEKEKTNLEEKISELKISLDEKNQINASLQEQLSKLEQKVQEKSKQIELLNQESEEDRINLRKQISELKISLDDEKYQLKNLTRQYERIQQQEQDKDKEISSLQTEIKRLIQSNDEAISKLEAQTKIALRDLASEKELVIKSEEKYKKLDKECKQVVQIFEIKMNKLEKVLCDKQTENDQLKGKLVEMEKNLNSAVFQLETFTKNRNETVLKYENLVESQKAELDKLKNEISDLKNKLLKPTKKNLISDTPISENSKENRCESLRKTRKVLRKYDEEDSCEEVYCDKKQIETIKIEKHLTTRNVDEITANIQFEESAENPPKSTKKPRKKKLFTPLEDSYVDLREAGEPKSCSKTRSLRDRKK